MLVAVLLPFLALGPGHFLAKPARLRPLQHVVVSFALGLLALFLAAFLAIVVSGTPKSYYGVTALAVLATLVAAPQIKRTFPRTKTLYLAFLAILAATILFTLPLRHLAGGSWIIDWHEHYSRSLFFLGKLPATFQFGSGYALPARPPLQNVLCAVGMAHSSESFPAFQLASTSLAALVLLPCAWLARVWSRGRVTPLLMAGVLVLTPPIVVQAIYPWTKLLTAFFVLTGLALYLETYRRSNAVRMSLVAALLAAGVLTHYSALPYALLIAAHFAFVSRSAKRILLPTLVAFVLLLPWFGWSLRTFGGRTTFASNSTAIESSKSGPLANLPANALHTLIPHPLLMSPRTFLEGTGLPPPDDQGFRQPSRMGVIRDYAFLAETGVLPFSVGLTGLLLLLPKLPQIFRQKFWRFFLPATFAFTLVIHPTPSLWGIAHVTMVPLTLLGAVRVAAELRRPGQAKILLACGLFLFLFDALALTYLHITAQARAFNIQPLPNDPLGRVIPDANTLSTRAVSEYQFKVADGIVMLGDQLSAVTPLLLTMSLAVLLAAWVLVYRCALGVPRRS